MTEYGSTTISDTQPRNNMTTMGKVDTSDLMMIIQWVTNISFQSPKLEWPVQHMQPHILQKGNRKN